MAKQRGRESNTGIVVTLVFFILLSIVLGVSTYYGFAGQAALTTATTTAVASEKDMKAQRDWYQFQAWTYRTYLGQTEGFDKPLEAGDKSATPTTVDSVLKEAREHFDQNQLGKDSKGDFADRAAVTSLIKKVESANIRSPLKTRRRRAGRCKTKRWPGTQRPSGRDSTTRIFIRAY